MIFDQTAGDRKVRVFTLSPSFLDDFKDAQPPWGPVGYFTFKRTYARPLPEGGTEEWWQTCQRVVEGTFNIQKVHCRRNGLPWNEQKAQKSAQDMFERMFSFKFTPPGRGLWNMGTSLVFGRGSAVLMNCAFYSTEWIGEEFSAPFTFLMDLSMLGVGVGLDTRGALKARLSAPKTTEDPFVVEDTREGWVSLIQTILESFVGKDSYPLVIDYSKVRGRGVPLKTMGGIASGPGPLQRLVRNLTCLLLPEGMEATFQVQEDTSAGTIGLVGVDIKGSGEPYKITSTLLVDIANYIGKAVIAGGVRRTAEIVFGDPDDQEFMDLKKDPEALKDRRWASNNSILANIGMDYSAIVKAIALNGEPGLLWLDNARRFSRMNGVVDNKDRRVLGSNPCGEQLLENAELCTLVETYPAKHDSYEDFQATLKMAYLYAKTVTLVPTHIPRSNAVMTRNRRIGCSMSGIVQAMNKFGRRGFLQWCDQGYDYIQKLDHTYSDWLGIPLSIKTTTVKPSGSVSLLGGATPGIHYPHSEYYIRHIRVQNTSPLVQLARYAGYDVNPDPYADDTSVIAFPIKEKHFCKGKEEVTVWEQFLNTADMQWHWSDNAVSCLTGDTLIRTSVGTLPMQKLAQEMGIEAKTGVHSYKGPLKVLDANNKWATVSALILNPSQPVVRVEMGGVQHLTGTLDQKVQVIGEDLQFCWKALADLQIGDAVVEILNHTPYPSAHQILQRRLGGYIYPGRSDADQVSVPTSMSPALAEFLGYMVADGWVQNSTGKTFGLSQKANNVADSYVELIHQLFNLGVRIDEDIRSTGDTPLLSLSSNSTKVAHWLQWLGLYDDQGFKRTPWPILMAGPQAIKRFLRGVTLDGHMSTSNGRIVVMTTNSDTLADELCVLLKQVGFQPVRTCVQDDTHKMVSPTNGKTYQCREAWDISLSAGQSSRFMRMIGFAEDHKNDAYEKFGGKTRRHLFGCVPDYGLRKQMQELSHRCSSRMMKDHWHSRGQHEGVWVSRETLSQMQDMGVSIPEHLLRQDISFRQVKSVVQVGEAVTFDLSVEGSHSYVANGFASHNCTVTFNKEEVRDLKPALEAFEDRLKGVSLLPLMEEDHGYLFPPYKKINAEQYAAMSARTTPIAYGTLHTHDKSSEDKFCTGDSCTVGPAKK